MTPETSTIQLTIHFEAGNETAATTMRIQLGEADIAMPLPNGLHFEGTTPLLISLSIPNINSTHQETHHASISSASKSSHEEQNSETAEDTAAKKQLLLPAPRSQKTQAKYQTQWPLVGGNDLIRDTSPLLSSKEFSEHYRPGIKRDVYIAGCPGLMELNKRLGIPIFKIGDCGTGRIADRIRQQSKDQYGAYYKIKGDWPLPDNGYDRYSALQVYVSPDSLHKNSPIKLLSRGLSVTLPEGMSRTQFSSRFQQKLASCSLIEWRYTDEAIDHFERRNIDPDIIDRFTDYGTAEHSDLTPATELYCIRNEVSEDCDRLIAVIENVILEHMGLI